MSDSILKIAVADPSAIIRSGLSALLKRIQGYHIHTFEVNSIEFLASNIRTHKPDLIIINPTYWGYIDIESFKSENPSSQLHFFAMLTGLTDEKITDQYSKTLSIYDDAESIKTKLDAIFALSKPEENDESQALSAREKEIIVGVVKGYTNKEIAVNLFLSTHTVITHRRNIARKLEIHSTAGLTIYAIVNKLVELSEISQK